MRARAALLALAAATVLPWPDAAVAATGTAALAPAAAINTAGRERMLTQRAAKAYLMLALQIDPARARTILDDSVARFDAQFALLAAGATSPELRAAHRLLAQRWSAYRAVLAASPSREGAREVYVLSEDTEGAAHRLTLTIERTQGTPVDRLVNIAGRQRMLAQRMAKYALFAAYQVQPDAARMELTLARAQFSPALRQLERAPGDDEIRAQLARLDAEWNVYRAVLDRPPSPTAWAEIGARSERMLEVSEALVTLYERQAAGAASRLPVAASGGR